MAGMDYRHCDKCGRRVFYDADIFERMATEGDESFVGDMKILCRDCAKTWRTAIVKRKTGREVKTPKPH